MVGYSSKDHTDIGRYVSRHGTPAALRYFSRKMERKLSTASIHSLKIAHLENAKRRRSGDSDDEVTDLPAKKRGRTLLLGDLDEKVQQYLTKVIEGGGTVSAAIAVAAAHAILTSYNRSMLCEFGGHIHTERHWAYGLLDRMKSVRRKATTAKTTVIMEEIATELILNWDQNGSMIWLNHGPAR